MDYGSDNAPGGKWLTPEQVEAVLAKVCVAGEDSLVVIDKSARKQILTALFGGQT